MEGVPRNGERIGNIRGDDGERDGHPDVVGPPAQLGRDLRRGNRRIGRISESALEVRADPPRHASRPGAAR